MLGPPCSASTGGPSACVAPPPDLKNRQKSSFLRLMCLVRNTVNGHTPAVPPEEMVTMSACPTGGDHDWILGDDRKFQCAKCGAQSARRF